jgi:hypothetical protein
MAKNAHQSNGSGWQDGNHCRPFSTYVTTPVVKTSAHSGDFDRSSTLAVLALDTPTSSVTTAVAQPAELNTGPPPGNLVVALHRFLI